MSVLDRVIARYQENTGEDAGGLYLGDDDWNRLRADRAASGLLQRLDNDQWTYRGIPVYRVRALHHMKVTD